MSRTPLHRGLREALDQEPRPEPPPGDRLAAVLATIIDERLIFIRRAHDLRHHPGQVAFPGGMLNTDDASLKDAALREFGEELGVDPSQVEVLGALTPVHIFVSGTLVVPFVGVVGDEPVWKPSADEVDEVFGVPLATLADAEREEEWERGGQRFMTYVYEIDDRVIWGATGHMLHELLTTIELAR